VEPQLLDRLTRRLWPEGNTLTGAQVHAVLDGARDERIEPLLRSGGLEYACLLAGPLTPALRAAAPFVVHLAPGSPLTERIFEGGWGRDWGFLTVAPPDVTLLQLRRHFRTLLQVQDESGRRLMFRFYDPRVLRVYLPPCTSEEAERFFGPVPQMLVRSTTEAALMSYEPAESGVRIGRISLQ